MHDGRVGRDRPADDISGVCEVDDDNQVLLTRRLPDTDEPVRFQCESVEADTCCVDAQVLEL